MPNLKYSGVIVICPKRSRKGCVMDFQWEWIGHFGSLGERDRFVAWMEGQIANGMAEEIEAPSDAPSDAGERWFRHIPTGSVRHLVSDEHPKGPGFWPAHENDKAA
jgi:hypothetical protein